MRLQSRPISWLPAPLDTREQWGPKVYHVRGWMGWSDAAKLRKLRELSEEYGRAPAFRAFVINQVLAGVADRDFGGQARAILRWTQSNIRYINEPDEQVQSPAYTVKVGFGDCDDMAVLMGAMFHAVGLPWRFALAGRDARGRAVRYIEGGRAPWGRPRYFHIYLVVGDQPFQPRQWISCEPTVKGAPLGYDVVIHGPPANMGEMQKPVRGMSGWGMTAPEIAASTRPRLLHPGSFWEQVVVGTLQGVITAVLLDRLLSRRGGVRS